MPNRRDFLLQTSAVTATALLPPRGASAAAPPAYLKGFERQYAEAPRVAAIEWFRQAKFGMFIHYGIYSLLGRHEWVQFREKIPVAEYAKLKDRFTAEKFDADFIADLAVAAEMKYINITTRHHDSFCLWDTKQTDFNSVQSPAHRDLVGELAEACRMRGLGLFFYYSHGRDWRHPDAPQGPEWGRTARPQYAEPQPEYHTGADYDLQRYVAFVRAQITELLTQYGPVAGIWLDGIGTTRAGDASKLHVQELYDHIHSLQPQVLVSYKQGLLGTEDFMAPEHRGVDNPMHKPLEICTTMQKGGWGWVKDAQHLTADEVWQRLAWAAGAGANLLLNTGPLGDGSIHPHDAAVFRQVGERIRQQGFPPPEKEPPRKPKRKRPRRKAPQKKG